MYSSPGMYFSGLPLILILNPLSPRLLDAVTLGNWRLQNSSSICDLTKIAIESVIKVSFVKK